jgi:hypothetical protein
MKVLKLKEDVMSQIINGKQIVLYKAGRLFTKHGYHSIALATPTLPTEYMYGGTFNKMIQNDLFEEVELSTQPWAIHHLLKEIQSQYAHEQLLKSLTPKES